MLLNYYLRNRIIYYKNQIVFLFLTCYKREIVLTLPYQSKLELKNDS